MLDLLRPMQASDIDRVYEIELASHRAPWGREILSDCQKVGYDCRVFETFIEGKKILAGYIICRYTLNAGHILNLCIDQSFQGKGYGKKLLERFLKTLPGRQIDSLVLEVRPTNKIALKMYDKFGFIQAGIRKEYYKDQNGIEDAIMLIKVNPKG